MNDSPPPYTPTVARASGALPGNRVTHGLPIRRDVGNLYDSALSTAANGLHNSGGRTLESGDRSGNTESQSLPPYSVTSFVTSLPPPPSTPPPSARHNSAHRKLRFPRYSVNVERFVVVQTTSYNRQGLRQQDQAVVVGLDTSQPPIIIQLDQQTNPGKFSRSATLACFVFWLCGLIFGGIAFILAIKAKKKEARNPTTSRRLHRASCIVSILGIVAGIIIISVLSAVISYYVYRGD